MERTTEANLILFALLLFFLFFFAFLLGGIIGELIMSGILLVAKAL